MDAIEVLKPRRSVRTYTREPEPKEIIEDIIDCGRLAPTAVNIQPWEFVVVTDHGMLRRIANTADYGKFIADALVCIVVLCRDSKYYLEDSSAATQNILLAARAHDLDSIRASGPVDCVNLVRANRPRPPKKGAEPCSFSDVICIRATSKWPYSTRRRGRSWSDGWSTRTTKPELFTRVSRREGAWGLKRRSRRCGSSVCSRSAVMNFGWVMRHAFGPWWCVRRRPTSGMRCI